MYQMYNFNLRLQYGQEAVKKWLPGHRSWLQEHQEFFRRCCPPGVLELLFYRSNPVHNFILDEHVEGK
jgi:hypothetical protein